MTDQESPGQPMAAPGLDRPVLTPPEPPSFVYALGQIEPRFPSLAMEKEFAQATGTPDSAGLTERRTLKAAISERRNRYLARGLCWVLVVQGLDTYILLPRDPTDLDLLIESYREEFSRDDLDCVIGVRRGLAPPDMCNGLGLPLVIFDQIYSFDRDSLIESIPRPDSFPQENDERFRSSAGELFDQLMHLADNAGAIDEHRAVNYLMVRYPRIYAMVTEQHQRNFSFTGVEVRTSRLSGARSIVSVVFTFRHRETDVMERQFARVDVTEELPFLATKLGPYYDR
jgi:hypothetical protein